MVCTLLIASNHPYLSFSGFTVAKDFLAQVGDPTATGTGGECILSYIAAQSGKSEEVPRYFVPNMVPRLKHTTKGTVSMAVAPALEGQKGGCGSQFFITLADNIDYLDGKHAVFGHVVEGLEVLDEINEVFVDDNGRPLKDVRIRHVVVLGEFVPFAATVSSRRHLLPFTQTILTQILLGLSFQVSHLRSRRILLLVQFALQTMRMRWLSYQRRRLSVCDGNAPPRHPR